MKLVDSSAWVQFLRRKGDPAVKHFVARILQADQAAYTCPIRFELLSGAKPNEQSDLEQTFSLSHHFPFSENDWTEAALLERQLRAQGLIIPRNDLFVATVGIRTELEIVCRDNHFSEMQKIVGNRLKVQQV